MYSARSISRQVISWILMSVTSLCSWTVNALDSNQNNWQTNGKNRMWKLSEMICHQILMLLCLAENDCMYLFAIIKSVGQVELNAGFLKWADNIHEWMVHKMTCYGYCVSGGHQVKSDQGGVLPYPRASPFTRQHWQGRPRDQTGPWVPETVEGQIKVTTHSLFVCGVMWAMS